MKINVAETAFIEVDVQNDFCPAYTSKSGKEHPPGALAVNLGDQVVAPLNALAEKFAQKGGKIVVSQDWHPAHHSSFASSHPGKQVGEIMLLPVPEYPGQAKKRSKSDFVPAAVQQVLWPDHCVQDSEGAWFHDDLNLDAVNLIIRKGYRAGLDSYSVFFENDRCTPTGLEGYLKGLKIKHILVGGLATDYCVLYSVMDALRLGFKVIVLEDAIRGVDIPDGSVGRAVDIMRTAGAAFIPSGDLV
jgi:nicotinamidase/pyrazinamidase